MYEQKIESAKRPLDAIPPGFYVDSKWLAAHGVLRSSVAYHTKKGKLRRLVQGFYRRSGVSALSDSAEGDWRVLVVSLQTLMGYAIHVGGMTALQQHGHRHDLAFGKSEPVYLYACRFPGWLKKVVVDRSLALRNTRLFADNDFGIEMPPGSSDTSTDSAAWWNRSPRMSEPERAILEALEELPDAESFRNLDMVFQSLVSLRPRHLMTALGACRSVKAKRLFFVFAQRHGHAWLRHLDRERIDMGKGDRALVKGGKLHPIYRITVPAEFSGKRREADDAN